VIAAGDEYLDQLSADEAGSSGDKGRRFGVACHVPSVGGRQASDHRQQSHSRRTTPVRPTVRSTGMKVGASGSFGAQLKALRETAGFTQEELATIAGLSVHAVSALERGQRRRPHVETVRALSAALDLTGAALDAFLASARAPAHSTVADELSADSLPLPLTTLLGRESDMETLRHWLADPAARLITLIGPGGVGKTRLVLELARAIAEEGATRVVFVPLVSVRDPTFVASAIAEALGLTDVAAADLPRRARVACGDQPRLLVLDNFEQVLDAAPLVVDLLASVAALRLLITSRAPLRVRGEREYSVAPLSLQPGTQDMSLSDLARVPAVRLFVERVRDVWPDFRLTPANGPTVAAICRRLDALPLALELAAPWMKVLTPEDLLRRLVQDVLLAAPGPCGLPERQQTMNATVAWSYQLLDPEEQRAFRRFGGLPGRFPIDAASAVLAGREASSAGSDRALRAVAGLIDKSLLLRAETSVPARPLYQMLETVRTYAALELAAASEHEEAVEGLVRYCADEASLAAEGLVGPAQVEWLDRVRDDLENYRVAMTRLIERGRSVEAAHIAWGLWFFCVIRGHTTEGLRWYQQILNLPSLPAAAEVKALLGAGAMSHTQGELERARVLLTRALKLARNAGDSDSVAIGAWMLGHVEYAAGNPEAARNWFTESRDVYRALSVPAGVGSATSGLAWVALATGDETEAERLANEAVSQLTSSGQWFLSLSLYIRILLALRRGNADVVFGLMRNSLIRVRESQDAFAVMYGLVALAAAAALKGDHAWVARILGAREAISERSGAILVDPLMQELHERVAREARAQLGPELWAQASAAGRKASVDAMLKEIDAAIG
jgi:predicted ATPase/DNA-binding XRE family transcriptional regulator